MALSRLTSMQGMVLYSRIPPAAIHTDERVLHFAKTERTEEELWDVLQEEQKRFVSHSLIETFSWQKLVDTLQQHRDDYEYRQFPGLYKAMVWAESLISKAKEQEAVAHKFAVQLERLLTTAAADNYALLHQRTEAAAAYFSKPIDELIEMIQQHINVWQDISRTRKYIKDLTVLQQVLKRKKMQMQHASHITAGLAKGLDAMALIQIVEEQRKTETAAPAEATRKESTKLPKGQTRIITLEMFRQGKTPEEIAVARGLAPTTIESHLAACVEDGEIDVHDLVPEAKISVILKAIEQTDGTALQPIKEKLSNDYTYAEIKAVMGYRRSFLQSRTTTEGTLS